jgi:hypothetical protein
MPTAPICIMPSCPSLSPSALSNLARRLISASVCFTTAIDSPPIYLYHIVFPADVYFFPLMTSDWQKGFAQTADPRSKSEFRFQFK